MKTLIAPIALLLTQAALAQTWLAGPCAVGPPLYAVPKTAAKPVCLPAPAGAGTALIVESNDFGVAAAWWCKPATLYLYAAMWEVMTTGMLADAAVVALSSSKTSAIQAHLLKYQTMNVRDMCDVWGPASERILAVKPTR